MAATHASREVAHCGCDCGNVDGMIHLTSAEEDDPLQEPWIQCECMLCGLEEGGRCQVKMSPILMIFQSIWNGPDRNGNLQLVEQAFCGQCREHNLLQRRREAVKRSRENRQLEDERRRKGSRLDNIATEHAGGNAFH